MENFMMNADQLLALQSEYLEYLKCVNSQIAIYENKIWNLVERYRLPKRRESALRKYRFYTNKVNELLHEREELNDDLEMIKIVLFATEKVVWTITDKKLLENKHY